jgi:hypothetical protein
MAYNPPIHVAPPAKQARQARIDPGHASRLEIAQRLLREVRAYRAAEAEALAVAMWETMSIRDIARELDTSIPFVQRAGKNAGIPSRPVSWTPGDPHSPRGRWARSE